MPTVPAYQEGEVALSTARPPAIRNKAPDATGAGEALQRIGGQIAQVGTEYQYNEQKKADDAQYETAAAQLGQAQLNAEAKALAAKGTDAPAAQDAALAEFDQAHQQVMGGLNKRVQPRVAASTRAQRLDMQRVLNAHGAQQHEIVSQAATKAAESVELAGVDAHAASPDAEHLIAGHTERLLMSREAELQRLGLATPEGLADARARTLQDVTATRLDALLADRATYPAAIAVYDANKTLLGTKLDEYGKKVKAANDTVQEIQQSDAIIARYGAGPAGIAQASKIQDEVLRERVERRLDAQRVRDEARIADSQRIIAQGVIAKIDKADPHMTLTDILTAPEQAAVAGVPGLSEKMQDYHDKRLRGVEPVTDPTVEAHLIDLLQKPDDLAKVNLAQYRNQLNNSDYSAWEQRIKTASDPSKRAQALTQEDVLAQAYADAKITSTASRASRDKLKLQFLDAKDVFVKEKKREPSADEMKALIKPLLLPLVKPGWFGTSVFGDTRPTFKIPAADRQDYQVPALERQKIIDAYQQVRKRAPTEQEIRDAYARKAASAP